MKVRIHCFVSGRVQGVSFRSFTVEKAEKLGLTGWVRNLDNGEVESVVEGEEEDVKKFLEQFGERLPEELRDELTALKKRL